MLQRAIEKHACSKEDKVVNMPEDRLALLTQLKYKTPFQTKTI